jgi:tetratricopeptide (TPR) repeat protein
VAELLIIVAAMVYLYLRLIRLEAAPAPTLAAPHPLSNRLAQMSSYADRLYAERKWLAAEKAYLAVLKLDHKNVTTYSHLGIIYSTQKNMPDAIECFEIAVRLHPSGSTLQNLGLAFYDNRNYIKAVAAFQKSIMLGATAARYVALSRALTRLEQPAEAVAALEAAVKLEPSKRHLELLAEARRPKSSRKPATS